MLGQWQSTVVHCVVLWTQARVRGRVRFNVRVWVRVGIRVKVRVRACIL